MRGRNDCSFPNRYVELERNTAFIYPPRSTILSMVRQTHLPYAKVYNQLENERFIRLVQIFDLRHRC